MSRGPADGDLVDHLTFVGGGGVRLAADARGPLDGDVVLLLPGGGQTRHSWRGTAAALAEAGCRAISLDQRGHGASGWAGAPGYTLDAFADDVRAVVEQVGRPVAVVGASLGGLAGTLALGEDPIAEGRALVLADATPRMDHRGSERLRAFMLSRPSGFESVEEVAQVLAAFRGDRPRRGDLTGLRRSLRVDEAGRYHWHWDPAYMSSRTTTDDVDADRVERALARVRVPILLVRGGRSEVVTAASVTAFLAVAPNARCVELPGAGHTIVGDQHDAFSAITLEFLGAVLQPPSIGHGG